MKRILLLLFVLMPTAAFAQLALVSSTPAEGATNVPLATTFSMTFNMVLDTDVVRSNFDNWIATNVDSGGDLTFGADGKSFSAPIWLESNTAYVVGLLTLKAKDGSMLPVPTGIHFTTAASFPAYTVSGTVSGGTTGVSPDNAFVGLTDQPMGESEGKPRFVAMGTVNVGGTFTISYVANGTYWPLSAKDVDGDGSIDPNNGNDVVAFGDSIVVNNASVTGVNLTYTSFTPLTLADAATIADSLARNLPGDRLLKQVNANDLDTTGKSESWSFVYVANGGSQGFNVNVSSFDSHTETVSDMGWLSSLVAMHTLTNPELAASAASVIANCEAQGGKAFRTASMPDSLTFQIQAQIGDLSMTDFWQLSPNPSLNYWGVRYEYGMEYGNYWMQVASKRFLCDFSTGSVLGVTNVREDQVSLVTDYALNQNYPNPFNPSTSIGFQVKDPGFVRLGVYDILGREVAQLVNQSMTPGHYTATWNAASVSSGVYVYRLSVVDAAGRELYANARRMVLVK